MIDVTVKVKDRDADDPILLKEQILYELVFDRLTAGTEKGLDGFIQNCIGKYCQVKEVEVEADWHSLLDITIVDLDGAQ